MAAEPVIYQDDFSAGMVRSTARHLIPRNGAYSIIDGLLDDDGSVYRRGGSVYKSSSVFSGALRFLWDGYLPAAGLRTLVAYAASFGVLAADDAAPLAIGGGGLTEPKATAVVGPLMWIGGGAVYGGSRKTAGYSAGTVTTVVGSRTVVGSGTAWAANVDAGMVVSLAGDTSRFYVVASVESDTQLTLAEPYLGTAGAAQTYAAAPVATAGALSTIGANRGLAAAELYAAVGGRLVAASGNVVYLSRPVDLDTGRSRPQEFDANDRHELPDGVSITGLAVVRDRLVVFTTAGVWMLSDLDLPIVDPSGNPQHRKEQVNADLTLWGQPGVATWRNALVVPTTETVVLLDGISPPVDVGGSLGPLYLGYVRAGCKPGQATVYNNHFFLPVLDSSSTVIDVLVCRLDRPTKHRGQVVFPWTRMRGHGGQVTAFATRAVTGAVRSPKLLAAGADQRVLDLSAIFEPAAGVKADADGTAHQLVVETRDYLTSRRRARNRNTVKGLRVRHETVDASGDNPTLTAWFSIGVQQGSVSVWDAFLWDTGTWVDADLAEYVQLDGAAPESDGRLPFAWSGWAAKTEFIRFQLRSNGACARCTLREIEAFVRENALVW